MPKVTKKFGLITIHELLITVVVITIISAIGFAASVNVPKRIRDSHRKTDINNIKLSLEAFYEKDNKYPPLGAAYSSQTIFVSDTIPIGASAWIPEMVPNFTKSLPEDPKQTGFIYMYYVPLDRKTYSAWAQLENTKDPGIYTHPEARCKDTPPAGYEFMNYCGGF